MYKLTDSTIIIRSSDGANIPPDLANRDYAEYLEWVAAGNTPIPAPAPTQQEIFAQAEAKIQELLDNQAKAWGYDSLLSAASYAASSVVQYKNEANALIAYRDAVWPACYSAMAAITAGTMPMPASIDAFIATLPAAPTRP